MITAYWRIAMRKIALLCVAALMLATAAAAEQPKRMSVNVKETQVRATPSFLGKVLGPLAYGDGVQVAETQKGWVKVKSADKGLSGWVAESALTAKRVVLGTGQGSAEQGASSGEVALAGKGFNSQIEAENKQDASFDYATVDRMEKIAVAPEAVSAFVEEGKLAQGGAK
jgi:SH3-like domain-containing protein